MALKVTVTHPRPGVMVALWDGLTTSNRGGDWLPFADFPDKTVEVWGVFGAGAAVQIEGPGQDSTKLETDADGPIKLNDSRGEGNPAVSGDKNCFVLNENPPAVRPYLTNGDANTLVSVRMTCTSRQG